MKLNEKKGDRDLEREIKKGDIFLLEEQHENFVAAVGKMKNDSGHECKVKMSGSEKKVNENKYDIFSQKPVTKTFLEVVVVQNNGKKMYKKVCYTSKVTFFTN